MRVRNTIVFLLVFLTILVMAFFIILKATLLPIKFSSIHPNISVSISESLTFNIYSNYVLKIKTKELWGARPKVIGVIYTDKIRPNYQILNDGRDVDFGSLINIDENKQAIIYVYVSEEIINKADAKNEIREYTVNTIKYFQQDERIETDLLSKFVKLPIDVKSN